VELWGVVPFSLLQKKKRGVCRYELTLRTLLCLASFYAVNILNKGERFFFTGQLHVV